VMPGLHHCLLSLVEWGRKPRCERVVDLPKPRLRSSSWEEPRRSSATPVVDVEVVDEHGHAGAADERGDVFGDSY
jgi:hypothetical protein